MSGQVKPGEFLRMEPIAEAINAEFERAVKAGDQDGATDIGHRFHREINLAADSRRLALLLRSVVRHLPNRFYASIEGHLDATRNDHAELIEALRARNARKGPDHHRARRRRHGDARGARPLDREGVRLLSRSATRASGVQEIGLLGRRYRVSSSLTATQVSPATQARDARACSAFISSRPMISFWISLVPSYSRNNRTSR